MFNGMEKVPGAIDSRYQKLLWFLEGQVDRAGGVDDSRDVLCILKDVFICIGA